MVKKKNIYIWVLWPFQEYCTYIEPIVNQMWAKTGVPEEKLPDLPVQNLASNMCPGRGSNPSIWFKGKLSDERINSSENLYAPHRGDNFPL